MKKQDTKRELGLFRHAPTGHFEQSRSVSVGEFGRRGGMVKRDSCILSCDAG